jgi:transposase, IS5 family
MALKRSGQFSFVDALMPSGVGGNERLDRLLVLLKWYRFEKILGKLRNERQAGRPAYEPLVMFKALLLQSLYGLSDAELEDAVQDRLSFRRFVGLSLEDTVPDHSTLCRFRNLLIAAKLLDTLFGELDKQLDAAGMILRRGTMLDATVIETTAPRPPYVGRSAGTGGRAAENQIAVKLPADPDAAFVVRQGKRGAQYGYKAHVAVDQGSGLIRRVLTTPANVNDTTPADLLICGDERAVLADAAYHTHAREAALKRQGIKCRLMRRPNKYHKLSPRLQRLNTLISRQRSAVETTFATLKRRMGLGIIRYYGLAKAEGQVMLAAMAFNMRRWVTLAP